LLDHVGSSLGRPEDNLPVLNPEDLFDEPGGPWRVTAQGEDGSLCKMEVSEVIGVPPVIIHFCGRDFP
jgi:hypothetical protein